jgi:hypothetical protein
MWPILKGAGCSSELMPSAHPWKRAERDPTTGVIQRALRKTVGCSGPATQRHSATWWFPSRCGCQPRCCGADRLRACSRYACVREQQPTSVAMFHVKHRRTMGWRREVWTAPCGDCLSGGARGQGSTLLPIP